MIANSIFQQCAEESDLGFAFTADLNFLTTLIMYYVKCPSDWNNLSYISHAHSIYSAFGAYIICKITFRL